MASRSDKIFQRRKALKKGEISRRRSSLAERQRVLIVCEGEKTEPLYLRSLINSLDLTTAEVEICGECGSAPISVVDFGIEKLKSDESFDIIFFVFDRDSHTCYDSAIAKIEGLKSAKKYANKDIQAITSVPCFEVWFLLHFSAQSKPYNAGRNKSPCGNLISVLKKTSGFEQYEKGGKNYFDLLHGRLAQAKINSKQVLEQLEATGAKKHHANSSTLMHILVETLEQLSINQKR